MNINLISFYCGFGVDAERAAKRSGIAEWAQGSAPVTADSVPQSSSSQGGHPTYSMLTADREGWDWRPRKVPRSVEELQQTVVGLTVEAIRAQLPQTTCPVWENCILVGHSDGAPHAMRVAMEIQEMKRSLMWEQAVQDLPFPAAQEMMGNGVFLPKNLAVVYVSGMYTMEQLISEHGEAPRFPIACMVGQKEKLPTAKRTKRFSDSLPGTNILLYHDGNHTLAGIGPAMADALNWAHEQLSPYPL